MNCASCNAQLAPGSATCFFCGAAQPSRVAPGSASTGWSPTAQPSAPGYAGWAGGPATATSESWRVWAAFFLGGLYGPIAGQFLLHREEWTAGLRPGSLPPTTPSHRGLVVLALFVLLPMMYGTVLSLTVQTADVYPAYNETSEGAARWYGLAGAYRAVWFNLVVAGFYAVSTLVARMNELRYEVLLAELTGSDPTALREFRAGRVLRLGATAIGFVPFFMLVEMSAIMLTTTWHPVLSAQGVLFMFACIGASAATSWLNIAPAARYRAVMFNRP